jgi:hypothetical protein
MHRLHVRRATPALSSIVAGMGIALFQCSSGEHGSNAADASDDGGGCFPDADGLIGGSYTIDLTVDDSGFSKNLLNTQNDATVTLTLTNNGTTPHGFEVDCTSVAPAYPNLSPMCPSVSCFPGDSTIAPIAPGQRKTVTFFTPTADNLIYPFKSSAPNDSTVPGLNNGQWSLM